MDDQRQNIFKLDWKVQLAVGAEDVTNSRSTAFAERNGIGDRSLMSAPCADECTSTRLCSCEVLGGAEASGQAGHRSSDLDLAPSQSFSHAKI